MKIHSIYCSRDSFYACSVKNVLFCFMSYCSCYFDGFCQEDSARTCSMRIYIFQNGLCGGRLESLVEGQDLPRSRYI